MDSSCSRRYYRVNYTEIKKVNFLLWGVRILIKKLFIHALSREVKIALLEDGKLTEYFVERPPAQRVIGNIYVGKIENVLPGMQAAFVDIGQEKNAFLYVDEILPSKGLKKGESNTSPAANVQNLVHKGEKILVQVHKEGVGNKGPKVTTNISLPGRYLVYMPFGIHVGISRQIEEELERERLKEIGQELVQGTEGLIIRTVCEGVDERELVHDLEQLRQLWKEIQEQAEFCEPKDLVYHEADLIPKIVRDYMSPELTECWVNDPRYYQRLKQALKRLPLLLNKVKFYSHAQDMFDYFGITPEIDKAIRRKIWLKSGGYIIFDQTEALTVIDVNTGKFVGKQTLEQTVLQTNIEAAQEITRQLRLRDIGGITIIDFIDMVEDEHKQQVLTLLEEGVKRDRTKTTVVGLTALGLVELTRKKVRQSLLEVVTDPCPYCEGMGYLKAIDSVAAEIERLLLEYRGSESKAILLEAHPSVVSSLEGEAKNRLKDLEEKCGISIAILANPNLHLESYKVLYQGTADEVRKRWRKLTASLSI